MGRSNLIAVDDSEPSLRAFEWYLENMHRDGDKVILVHCAEFNIDIGLHTQLAKKAPKGVSGAAADVNAICAQVKKRQDEIASLTEDFAAKLREKKVDSKVLTPHGAKPGDLICTAAKENNVDSIIIGTRGLGKIKRALLGSVSEYVLHHANCPVTVVRTQSES